jgi:hypothetical protein
VDIQLQFEYGRAILAYFSVNRELKEPGIIIVDWISTEHICALIFTKSLFAAILNKHARKMCGDKDSNFIQREGVMGEPMMNNYRLMNQM